MTRKKIRTTRLSANWIGSLPKPVRDRAARSLSPDTAAETAELLHYDWSRQARDAQKPPAGDWRVWLLLAGRGFGKTRSGAEYVRAMVGSRKARRVALVGPTAADVRAVMVEGESGLLSICPPDNCPLYEPANHRLVWPDGAVAMT